MWGGGGGGGRVLFFGGGGRGDRVHSVQGTTQIVPINTHNPERATIID